MAIKFEREVNDNIEFEGVSRAEMKDLLIASKSFGKKVDPKLESDLTIKIAEKTTFENILVYDRVGATPLEIAKDFDPILNGDMSAILSSRFKVINRPTNEVSFDYMKFAVGCSVHAPIDKILWLKRNSPDLYGKTVTGVSGHVAYDDMVGWNTHRHTVAEFLNIIDQNMMKEFLEEIDLKYTNMTDYTNDIEWGNNWISGVNISYRIDGIAYKHGELDYDYRNASCELYPVVNPLTGVLNRDSDTENARVLSSRALVCNTDMYGNNPYITFMYKAFFDDGDIFQYLQSGEPNKHELYYGTLDDLLSIRNQCTTLLPQLLK